METRVREFIADAKANDQNWCFDLPSDPERPMQAIVSHRLVTAFEKAPHPFKIGRPLVRDGALQAFEKLLSNFCGADLDHCLLVDKLVVQVKSKEVGAFSVRVVAAWERGVFGIFSTAEIQLGEEFFIDRLLFQTELQHHAEALDE